jgi:hypothetical protein
MSVTRLVYEIAEGYPHDVAYLDIARDLSVINRKLIRQKAIFTVMGGMMKDSGGSDLRFSTAPMTWTSKLAVNRAFKQWRKLQAQTYKRTEGLRAPKYNDFKVYLDGSHSAAKTLTPVYSPGKLHTLGEWNYSTLVQPKLIEASEGVLGFDADADSWDMQIVGNHDGTSEITTDDGQTFYQNLSRVGLIKSWYDSRPVPIQAVPNNAPAIRTDPLSNLFDIEDDDSEMVSVIESENDLGPYDKTNVQGVQDGETQVVSFVDNTAGEPDVVTIPGFQALCGLVKIDVSTNNGSLIILDVQTQGERF